MAEHKLSILVEAIGAAKASSQLKGVEKSISNIGARAGQGVRTAGGNLVKVGAVAAAGIAVAVKSGLSDLAELESAVTSVDGAIAQVGDGWTTTGADIAGIANRIESAIGAAFDDKEIVAATSGLIRYGKVSEKNLTPAMQVMTDLAARVGSVSSAGEILAKALADPARAAGKLSRYGIILTKTQQDQIKAMVKAGDVAGAQTLLLDELAKSTTGAAAASQGPYQRALSVMEDVTEDARKALAEGFLPVITKVADLLSTELAKPGTMDNIREFGKTLASGLENLVDIARNLPWQQIGDSLKIAGAGAKTVLGMFSSMPPWVQTAILTGWGLNKLTGGAVGGIVGELGKGLIKGVLGMNAGVVNINAGVVNGGGAGAVAGAAGAAKGLGMLSRVFLVGEAIGLTAAVVAVQQGISQQMSEQATAIQSQTQQWLSQSPTREQLVNGLAGVRQGISDLQSNPLHAIVQGDALTKLQQMESDISSQIGKLDALREMSNRTKDDTVAAQNRVRDAAIETKRETSRGLAVQAATVRSTTATQTAAITAAIRASKPEITVNTYSNVTTKSIKEKGASSKSAGKTNGSYGQAPWGGTGEKP